MTTYTIKPIEWRENRAFSGLTLIAKLEKLFDSENTHYIAYDDDAILLLRPIGKEFPTLDEAKSFIETSYREFIEQFLEKQ